MVRERHIRSETWILIALLPSITLPSANAQQHWPQWRDPLGTGVAPHADPPVDWSERSNIRWKTPLPGRGHSTPIVWGTRIFLTAAMPIGEELPPRYSGAPVAHDNLPITRRHQFVVLALDRQTGKILWQRSVREALPHEGAHISASLASQSPVTGGQYVTASFGSYGLYSFDLNGSLRWERDLGRMNTKHGHGEGSSPALAKGTLIVNWDHEGQSYLLALDEQTGETVWKVLRDEVTSWATPIVVEHDGRQQVIVSGTKRVRGYDLASGELLWECGGMSANIAASPVYSAGMVYVGSSYDTRALLAIRLEGAQGDITRTAQVVWRRQRATPYVPSPLLYDDYLYFLSHYQGVLTRVAAKTGENDPGPVRLGGLGNVYASPVAAAGRIYITDLNGATLVLDHAGDLRVLARNRLNDRFSASAALVDGELLLRGATSLYCIAVD